MKRTFALILSLILLLGSLPVMAEETTPAYSEILILCYMSSFGKEAQQIIYRVQSAAPYLNLTEEDFTLRGCVRDGTGKAKTSVPVQQVSFTKDSIILDVSTFLPDKSQELVMDSTIDALDFTYNNVTRVVCPEHDAFTNEEMTVGSTTVQYKLYSPNAEEGELLPIVIYHHGGGCTGFDGVLTDDSFACAWALEENQYSIPCYVMAPYRASVRDANVNAEEEREAIKAAIDSLVDTGKVDPCRIYMCGESMGSIYSVAFANAYPNYLAAIAVMNGGPLDIAKDAKLEEAVKMDLASPWSNAELQALAESQTAVMFIQATGDIASVPIRYATVYTKLVEYGKIPDVSVVWHPITAHQFNALLKGYTKIPIYSSAATAVDPITGIETPTNGNFHNSSRVAGWDSGVRTWLMIQKLEKPYVITCIGDSITYGAGAQDPAAESWPAQLKILLGKGFDVLNYGKAGHSLTSRGVSYLERPVYKEALASRADMYIVMLGTNDSYEDTWDPAEYETCLNRVVDDLQAADQDTVIYLMIPPHVFIDLETKPHSQLNSIIGGELYQIVSRVAEERNTGLINLFDYTENRADMFCQDMLHPSKEGYTEIAAYIYEQISDKLP